MTPQTQRTAPAQLELIDQAADKIAAAGGKDPGAGYVYGLPDLETVEEDLTLAVQLLRRAQSRIESWEASDLRALAAELIHRFGSAHADVDDTNDDFGEVAAIEFPDLPPITAELLDEVRDYMREAVIEIEGTRYNDRLERADHLHPADHQNERPRDLPGAPA